VIKIPLFEDIVHKALASEIRREILLTLSKGDKYLTEIAKEVGKSPQTIDFHLNLLEEIGLVESEWRKGKKYYVLRERRIIEFLRKRRPLPPQFRPRPPHEIMMELQEEVTKRLDRIDEKLNTILRKLEKSKTIH
jgi:predicted transcriptional regulator